MGLANILEMMLNSLIMRACSCAHTHIDTHTCAPCGAYTRHDVATRHSPVVSVATSARYIKMIFLILKI